MSKFLAPLLVLAGLVAFVPSAHATQLSACQVSGIDAYNNLTQTCSAYESEAALNSGSISMQSLFSVPDADWFTPSYAIIWDMSGIFTVSHALDVVTFTRGYDDDLGSDVDTMTLYISANAGFASVFGNAQSAAAQDRYEMVTQGAVSTFYVAWDPDHLYNPLNPTSAFDGCGASDGGPNGSCDTISIYADISTSTSDVPEPATLTLFAIGGAVAAIRRQRKIVW